MEFRHLRYSEGRWFQGRGIASSLVVLRGFAKGQGSHANPAKRFVWEKEEQRNGRRLSAASGGQDEGCGVCSDANPPLLFFLSTVNGAFFLIKESGVETVPFLTSQKKVCRRRHALCRAKARAGMPPLRMHSVNKKPSPKAFRLRASFLIAAAAHTSRRRYPRSGRPLRPSARRNRKTLLPSRFRCCCARSEAPPL